MDAILSPFDEDTQALLKELDVACAAQINQLRADARKKSLIGEPYEADVETMVWLKFIKGYGILYNRAVDAGWLEDIIQENKNG